MKQLLAIIFLLFIIFMNGTMAQKSQHKVIYTHSFPPEMSEEVKKTYIKLFEKGRILYQVNCAKCHNTKVNGVEVMPEFTKEHLAQYELRIQNAQHEEALSEMRVNAEELQQIMIFLTYYKKAGQPSKPKK